MRWLNTFENIHSALVYAVVCHNSDEPAEIYLKLCSSLEDAQMYFLSCMPERETMERWAVEMNEPCLEPYEYAQKGMYVAETKYNTFVVEIRAYELEAEKICCFNARA